MIFYWNSSKSSTALSELQGAVDNIERHWHIKPRSIFCLRLVVEELVSNLINHNEDKLEISLVIKHEGETLQITIKDNGKKFDPLAVKAPDITAPLENRQPGGLGLYLIKKKCNCFKYKRVEPYNISTVTIAIN